MTVRQAVFSVVLIAGCARESGGESSSDADSVRHPGAEIRTTVLPKQCASSGDRVQLVRSIRHFLLQPTAHAAATRQWYGMESIDSSAVRVLPDDARCREVAAAYFVHLEEQKLTPFPGPVVVIQIGTMYLVGPLEQRGERSFNTLLLNKQLRVETLGGIRL